MESRWNVRMWLIGVVSRRRVWLVGVGGIYGRAQVQRMDVNCGEWVECIGVASRCG